MNKQHKTIQVLMALMLVISLLAPAAMLGGGEPARLHPLLAEIAAEAPEQLVRVIVQKADDSGRAERFVERFGGQVATDLHIINAFVAELPAGQAEELAELDSVGWVSLDAPVASTGKGGGGKPSPESSTETEESTSVPENYFLDTLGVRQVWDMGYKGDGVSVAVIDSGVSDDVDFGLMTLNRRLIQEMSFNSNEPSKIDTNGHGTHVAGIIAGDGTDSNGLYTGIAPHANLINLKISDGSGMAYESDTVEAMQWALDNKATYNIRVVNLSIQSTVEQSYHTSPLDAAAEILWFNGVVVVAASGNLDPQNNINYSNAPPANDPFIITVGASDESGTTDYSDDFITAFTAWGVTTDGFLKPEIIAPGKDIISVLSKYSDWELGHPDRVVHNGEYFRISGTSMAAPMVAGAAALLLQAEPDLTPDQVKFRLMASSRNLSIKVGKGKDAVIYTFPYLDVYQLLTEQTTESANTGVVASELLWTGEDPVLWESVNWNSVNWNSVNWNSVNWNAVNWNAVNWNAVSWSQ